MLKKACLVSALICSFQYTYSQSTFLPINSEDHLLLDRLETRSGRLSDTIALGDQAETRRNAVRFLESLKNKEIRNQQNTDTSNHAGTLVNTQALSQIDLYNLEQMLSENGEWSQPSKTGKLINYTSEGVNPDGAINSQRTIFKTFYKKQYDMLHVNADGLFLVVNPVSDNIIMQQHNTGAITGSEIKSLRYFTSRGAEIRGHISKKVGFYTSITDNQEQYPYFVNNYVTKEHQSIPGADYFMHPASPTGAYDYMQAIGYINFEAVKNHVNITLGNGKHFLGDGISSLFLTDNSSSMPYMQIQTRIWRLNYECLYLELTPQYDKGLGDGLVAHKFSTIHYLSWNTNRWLNLGFFEAEVFDRPNVYEASYLNPIIFSTAVNRFNGEGDKSILGMSAKILAAKHFQFYGQLMFNEFRAKELFGSKNWYGNKWGVQMGGKYFDAFGIRNLDLQGELDVVRPYTYSAKDTLANYTNYNQPMADPLGCGFIKAMGIIRYQPRKNLYLSAKATYYVQGVDTGGVNFGNNIFNTYRSAESIYGVKMINGIRSNCAMVNLNISYQVRRNLFVDLGGTYRKYTAGAGIDNNGYTTTGPIDGSLTSQYFYLGVRINAARRDYDLF